MLLMNFMLMISIYSQIQTRPLNTSKLGRPVGVLAKTVDYQKTTNVSGGYIDYEEYDRALFAGYQRFVDFQNVNFTDTGSLWRSYVGFPELILTKDYQSFTLLPVSWNEFTRVIVDTVFFGFAHWNNSGTNDTINVFLMGMDEDNRPIDTNVFWSDRIISDKTLVGTPTPLGIPIRFLSIPVGVIALMGKFAMAIEYRGAVSDTFAVLFGYPSNGNQCGSLTNGGSPLPAPQPTAVGTHHTFFRVNLGNTNSTLVPTTAGIGYWYLDCNGNNTPDWPDENTYQNLSFWVHVTIDGPSSLMAYPNPAANSTTLIFGINQDVAGTVEVRNLAGQLVMSVNQQFYTGKNKVVLDLSTLANGIYSYQVIAADIILPGKLVVTH